MISVVNGASISDLAGLLRRQPNSNVSMVFMNDKSVHVVSDKDSGESVETDFGVLQPINVYQEPYLLAHTLINGRFV